MKNKLKFLVPFFLFCFLMTNVFAIEDFKFEGKVIEIDGDNNIRAREGVKVTTEDGLEILANESYYDKNNRVLRLNKDVSILDTFQELEISSNNIIYDKSLEKIVSKDKTEINVNNTHVINGENIIFLRFLYFYKLK